MDGLLLIHKPVGMSSFGVVERLQRLLCEATGARRRDPSVKMGHGGTLDPFATGLLLVCVGKGVKLARYFLASQKTYTGIARFGETTIPGDPTAPISETSDHLPTSLEEIQASAQTFTLRPYLQIPPMHSAKKVDGKPLYELARQGIEIERDPKLCSIYRFELSDYDGRRANFEVSCSAGTYIRTLAGDLGRLLGTVAMLDALQRTGSGSYRLEDAFTLEQMGEASKSGSASWDQLPCWVPFDRMLDHFARAEATPDEAIAIMQGRQNVLSQVLQRFAGGQLKESDETQPLAIYAQNHLLAVARRENQLWGLERVFPVT